MIHLFFNISWTFILSTGNFWSYQWYLCLLRISSVKLLFAAILFNIKYYFFLFLGCFYFNVCKSFIISVKIYISVQAYDSLFQVYTSMVCILTSEIFQICKISKLYYCIIDKYPPIHISDVTHLLWGSIIVVFSEYKHYKTHFNNIILFAPFISTYFNILCFL